MTKYKKLPNYKFQAFYLRFRFQMLNTIKAVAIKIPILDTTLMHTNNGIETVLRTRRTIVRSCGT